MVLTAPPGGGRAVEDTAAGLTWDAETGSA